MEKHVVKKNKIYVNKELPEQMVRVNFILEHKLTWVSFEIIEGEPKGEHQVCSITNFKVKYRPAEDSIQILFGS